MKKKTTSEEVRGLCAAHIINLSFIAMKENKRQVCVVSMMRKDDDDDEACVCRHRERQMRQKERGSRDRE